MAQLSDADYRGLLSFRTELRGFLLWSEQAAARAGLTPALHQLLLAVRGHAGDQAPSVGDVAAALHMRHHSAVELAQRAESAGLLTRERDAADHRRMRLELTQLGERQLEPLTREHLPQIRALASALEAVAGEVSEVGEVPRTAGRTAGDALTAGRTAGDARAEES